LLFGFIIIIVVVVVVVVVAAAAAAAVVVVKFVEKFVEEPVSQGLLWCSH
jgi:hypothetical protein